MNRHRYDDEKVITLPAQERVRLHVNVHIQVPVASTPRPRVSPFRNPQLCAARHAGRHAHRHRLAANETALRAADLAALKALAARARARRARFREHHVPARPLHPAGRVAMRTAAFRRANPSRTRARPAEHLPGHDDLAIGAAERFLERDRQ